MSDVTPAFNMLLKKHDAPAAKASFNPDKIDEFLKEAYRISSLITRLHTDLLSIRQAYLSTAAPRKSLLRTKPTTTQPPPASQRQQHLTDRDREEIDASAKVTLRDLNASIRALADAEQLRRDTEAALARKRRGRGGVLGAWAAGGGGADNKRRSPEQVAEEDRAGQVGAHREAVLWFLRRRLQEVGGTQQRMMETRLTREVEKSRSVLAKAGGGLMGVGAGGLADFSGLGEVASSSSGLGGSGQGLAVEEEEGGKRPQLNLTDEQQQMFEKGNQDMLKHYESTLDKVRTAEKSLLEISELQTLLVSNLETQSAHIDQLVADSFRTTDDIGGGNKELKKAAQRASPARYTFFAASGLCLFLIVWDLVI
ncbi:hypothetical protein QBC33DRAFT_493039 [Phialemonium atrogriseum]|uniref:SNARE-complex protein Syntaxin-18 N-terminal domain-containing protein n=1 Tax=Phialemonium atrogriseum TaxID=1093897 RepID=A0AAJ0BZ24_9PEZI|nr:uncharacterized protein QBC33DRAFT_493039 [Phialemonium atrogriseum]KAK1766930.1 hypothetical protein QBC33DRAFT_493039 [Phialemonium atrogriseum]